MKHEVDQTQMKVSAEKFKFIVQYTPLISIDLVIKNEMGQYLLGLRKNAPAQGFWFNLGGRIYKNETISTALSRIYKEEVGAPLENNNANLLGVFEHIYEDNVFLNPNFGTHYIVLGYSVALPMSIIPDTQQQHAHYRWWDAEDLMSSKLVHENTKICFR